MTMSFPPTTLAIDFGLRRIGLAISRASLAEPLAVIEVARLEGEVNQSGLNQAQLKQVLSQISSVIEKEGVSELVVGVSEGQMAQKSQAFAQKISQFFQLPYTLVDETLSSQEVGRKSLVMRKQKRSGHQDHLAAAEFLQDYLDNWIPEVVR